ncbi:MAG: hypothetical protein KBH33_06020 [Alicycliphilus sp.]|jgi:hypothetical protein|nr:hypothetical protein [Alicycliphilus sp.]MCA0441888.1 hypothetical protein [Pseudomonadota bacterium]HRL99681.1 hypothetical protein [Acidovorax sp.]
MPIIAAPSFWTSLSIVLPLACLGALAWLHVLIRRLARCLPDRNEDMVLNDQLRR